MITVHHLNNSRSQRILWMLEEIGIEYEIRGYQRDAKTNLAPQALKQVHPLGKSPVITDGDKTIAESGAIIEYLAETYAPHLIPETGTPAYFQAKYWLHFAEGSMMPNLVAKLIFDKVRAQAKPFFVKWIAEKIADTAMASYYGPNIENNFAFVNSHLKQNDWFAGEALSIADFQMSFPLEASLTRGTGDDREAIANWVQKVHARGAYQRALERGGKYDFA
ncbi:glutathione S-transferase [Aestuariibacter sp. AA17]|uniref:Glutathione S-transferase n=1 Tax=Fluctibacter corallii TaxID=2984329 RepID=A0ABT3AC29_9ALTE|nr:glutathione S-transferase [Aestuariibacter sp. AA17]MCV2886219.1 glutathione S-transferase [Aestuariibacter sp. AA17]